MEALGDGLEDPPRCGDSLRLATARLTNESAEGLFPRGIITGDVSGDSAALGVLTGVEETSEDEFAPLITGVADGDLLTDIIGVDSAGVANGDLLVEITGVDDGDLSASGAKEGDLEAPNNGLAEGETAAPDIVGDA